MTQGWPAKKPVVAPGKDVRGKVNLRPEEFDALVANQGSRVKVYRSSFCPNVKSIDGAEHEITCTLCRGSGFIDRYCIETSAFLQHQELSKGVSAEGLIDSNSILGTFLQGIELQYFTLVELVDFSEIFYERIKRQVGSLDMLRYPGLVVHMVVDSSGQEYYEGSDFRLDVNGNLVWCANKGPARDTIYSINYETKVRFRAIKAAHSNRFAQIAKDGQTHYLKMNEQWMLSKSYLVERRDIDGNTLQPNKIRDDDEY